MTAKPPTFSAPVSDEEYDAVGAAALEAFQHGYWPVPIRGDGSKAPALGSGYGDTQLTEGVVLKWFKGKPAGVGVKCGEKSGGLELFEFEGRAIREGLLQRFEQRLTERMAPERWSEIKRGWTDESPSGGIHFHYRCETTSTDRLASCGVDEEEGGRPLIETKGEGGYVVIAPSTSDASRDPKKEETWDRPGWKRVEGGPATVVRITIEEREALHETARLLDRSTKRVSEAPHAVILTNATTPVATIASTTTSVVDAFLQSPPGMEWIKATIAAYNDRGDWPSILGNTFEYLETDSTRITYLHYQGAENERSATLNAPNKANVPDALYVHSTTAMGGTPFEQGHVYDKFTAACLLKHGKNDQQARVEFARELRKQGYGPPPEAPTTTTTTKRAPSPCPQLPDTFWEQRRWLEHVRAAARSRQVAPDAVLGAFLTEICLNTHWRYLLPPVVGRYAPPNLIIAVVGRSGSGKGAAMDIAHELIGNTTEQVGHRINEGPAGSGEGIVKLFFGSKPKQADGHNMPTYHGVRVRIDEGSTFAKLAQRTGATTLGTVLQAFSGEALGNSVVSKDSSYRLPARSYRFAAVIGVQPELAGPIINDTTSGMAQRVLWFATTDTTHPAPDQLPAWPGPVEWNAPQWDKDPDRVSDYCGAPRAIYVLDPQIESEARHERGGVLDGADGGGHRTFTRLVVAALVATFDGRQSVTSDDWELAGQISDNSEQVCEWVRGQLRRAEERNDWQRGIKNATTLHATATVAATLERVERNAVQKISEAPNGLTLGQLRKALHSRDRDHVAKAIEHAEASGTLVQHDDGTYSLASDLPL